MKAEELRLCNFVEHEDPDEQVEGINFTDSGYKILIGNHLRPIEELNLFFAITGEELILLK